MTAPAFVDTNIWFYALNTGDEAKRIAANALI
jgi:predicted nucleic acid-binding protein